MQPPSRLTAALAAVVLVAACSESPLAPEASASTSNAAVTAPAYAVTATRNIAVAACTGGTVMLSADEKRTLDLHNAQRQESGLATFCVDAKLTAAARAHSDDMMTRSYFAHESADGTNFGVRLTGFGYTPFTALAENIAWGSGSIGDPDQIFTGWMNSTGHRTNIQNGALREIGIGVTGGAFQGYGGARMYTVDFGAH